MTLVELMIAVSILAIGIVAVLRSFITCATAFSAANYSILALSNLSSQMSALEVRALEEAGLSAESQDEELQMDSRAAKMETRITPLEGGEDLMQAGVVISWLQDNKEASRSLFTYLKKKKDETP